jgi:hypothetical protein
VEIQFHKNGYQINRFNVYGWNKRMRCWFVLMEDEPVKDLACSALDHMEHCYWKQIFSKTGGK